MASALSAIAAVATALRRAAGRAHSRAAAATKARESCARSASSAWSARTSAAAISATDSASGARVAAARAASASASSTLHPHAAGEACQRDLLVALRGYGMGLGEQRGLRAHAGGTDGRGRASGSRTPRGRGR